MKNKGKKIFGIVAAIAMFGATLAGCGKNTSYAGDKLTPGYDSTATVQSNGGFAVQKGDFVYFLNGSENYTADNTYGDVVKGALMRISVSDLNDGAYEKAQMVVPSLFTTAVGNSGIYIFGDYVYYATPTTDKNTEGDVENSWVDFKRAKIDGTAAPEERMLRLATSSADGAKEVLSSYRYVQEDNGDVYCLYEVTIDGAKCLKSYNVQTGNDVVLVKGAKSTFFYDAKNVTNPTVYYTMSVYDNIDSAHKTDAGYDQLYRVSASATATVNASEASYTVKDGKTYDFDEKYLQTQDGFKASDYTTYPYVNLGSLVLDGVGRNSLDNMFSTDKAHSDEPTGYNYTIQRYENDGVYFTRKGLTTTGVTDNNLYYLSDADGATINSVTGNQFKDSTVVDIVSNETTNASATALMSIDENGVHNYMYVKGSKIVKATAGEKGVAQTVEIANVSGATLLTTVGDYLYYYGTGTNGRSLSRINYTGEDKCYNSLLAEEDEYKEYQPITLALVDWSDSWYNPEFIVDANVVLYPNAQSYGGAVAYNYVYAARIDSTDVIQENIDKYKAVTDYKAEYSDSAASQALIEYFFRSGLEVSEESKAEYDEEFFAEVVEKFGENGFVKQSDIIGLVGRMTEDDAEAISESWKNSLLQPDEEETVEDSNAWIIWVVVGACALVIIAAVVIVIVISSKKKAAKRREEEATVNAYRRKKIDTTDDKSIDVYADEKVEEPAEETAQEATEEVAEEQPVAQAEEESVNE